MFMKIKLSHANAEKKLQEEHDKLLLDYEKIQQELEFYKTLVDELPIPIFAKNEKAKFCVLNKSYTEFFNIEAKEYLNHSVLELTYLPPKERQKYQQEDIDAIRDASEIHYKTSYIVDDRITPALYWSKGIHVPNSKQKGLVGAIVDLSEQSRLELELAEKISELENAYKSPQEILDEAPFGVSVFDKKCHLVDINKALIRIFGTESKEEFRKLFFKQQLNIQEDGRTTAQLFYDEISNAFIKGTNQIEAFGIHKNGNIIPIDITYRKANLNKEEVVICYIRDLRKTKAMINDIMQAQKDAEESAKAKGEFLANMSHEIRTPLNGVLGLLYVLSMTKLTEKQHDYVEKILLSANNLSQVLSDILDLSELDSGKAKIGSYPFTLQEVYSAIRGLFTEKASQKNISFSINMGEFTDIGLIGDLPRLNQVIFNLLDNAIKFTKEGVVSFSVKKINSDEKNITYRFAVNDTGIGIEQDKIDTLFSAFAQSDTSVTRKYGGIGLGLTICKRILELMGSNIFVESIIGHGSHFYFDMTFTIDHSYTGNSWAKNPEIERVGNILLVEDSKTNQLVATELLTKKGHKIDVANNGLEAINMLEKNCYDLVLMDIQMPVMDGLTATKIIRDKPQYADLPIIAISAHSLQSDIEKSLRFGMNEHLTKPISPRILYYCIDRYLQRKKSLNSTDK